jgi:hypothetical protein
MDYSLGGDSNLSDTGACANALGETRAILTVITLSLLEEQLMTFCISLELMTSTWRTRVTRTAIA